MSGSESGAGDRRPRSFRRAPVGAVLLALLLLVGCAQSPTPVPSPGTLAGTWREDDGGALRLEADGTGSASRLWIPSRLVSGAFRWHLGDRSERSEDGDPLVTLEFPPESRAGIAKQIVSVHGAGSSTTLEIRAADPDDAPIVLRRS